MAVWQAKYNQSKLYLTKQKRTRQTTSETLFLQLSKFGEKRVEIQQRGAIYLYLDQILT